MRLLKIGSTGPAVQLLQLALNRAGFGTLATDGIYGEATRYAVLRFQAANGLESDGIVGSITHRALLPWYTGYVTHTVHRFDTIYTLAQMYSTSVEAVLQANPGVVPENLQIGMRLIIPLPFEVVPTDIRYSSELVTYCVQGLAARYPFIRAGEIGRSVMGRPIRALTLGRGENRVLYNAAHHANEWITTPLLLKYVERLAAAYASGGELGGYEAAAILEYSTVMAVPAVNPDGIDLVTGELSGGPYYTSAVKIAENYPRFSFPSGWKANIQGIDPNLQYPAGWEQAREIKFAQGVRSPAPQDYVGPAPLTAPESRAMYDLTLSFSPNLTVAWHTQGQVIYWRYLDREPPSSRAIADTFSYVSGYSVEETPYVSGFAGYKDWFIDSFDRPGYTVEAGVGTNPLPITDFDGMYEKNLGIFVLGTLLT